MSKLEFFPSTQWRNKLRNKSLMFLIPLVILIQGVVFFIKQPGLNYFLFESVMLIVLVVFLCHFALKYITKTWSLVVADDVLHINLVQSLKIENVSQRIASDDNFYTFSESPLKLSKLMFPELEQLLQKN